MEYALWDLRSNQDLKESLTVLILVLMEYALWAEREILLLKKRAVLILVLMEYALWDNYAIFASSMPASS